MESKGKIVSSFIWKLGERSIIQLGRFVVQLVLARILMPEEYGLIALMTVFIAIADVIVQSGLNTALIQKKTVDSIDYSTVLIVSIIFSIILYTILYYTAPFIALWYKEEQITFLLRILGLNLLSGAIYSVQIAYISKTFNFRANFTSSFISIVVSGIIGITLALLGYGIWSMIALQLINQALSVILLAIYIKKIPPIRFSFLRLKGLFSFGWKVMVSSIIATLTENLYNASLAKVYSTEIVGYYSRGHQFPTVLSSSVNATISSVFLPYLSSEQIERKKVKQITRKGVEYCCFFIFPLLCGLMAIAEPMVQVLLTEKWMLCVPFIRLECLFYLTLPIIYVQGQATKAIGNSGIGLMLEFLKILLTIISIAIFNTINIYLLISFRTVISFITLIILIAINKKLIDYCWHEVFADVYKSLICSIVMGVSVYCIQLLSMSNILTLLLQIIIGVLIYAGLSILTRNQVVNYILKLTRSSTR